jgi:hypothetical protein
MTLKTLKLYQALFVLKSLLIIGQKLKSPSWAEVLYFLDELNEADRAAICTRIASANQDAGLGIPQDDLPSSEESAIPA